MGMSATMAQEKQIELSLHLGGSKPVGMNLLNGQFGFGSDVGIKFKYNIPYVDGLGIIATADFFWNGPSKKQKLYKESFINYVLNYIAESNYSYSDDLDDTHTIYNTYNKTEGVEADVILSNYINIPLMFGVNYEFEINDNFSLFGELGGGINIAKITKYEEYNKYHSIHQDSSCPEYDYERYETTIKGRKYDIQTNITCQVGGGIKFKDKFSLGIHYHILGNIELKGEKYSNDEYRSEPYNFGNFKTSILIIRLGYHF